MSLPQLSDGPRAESVDGEGARSVYARGRALHEAAAAKLDARGRALGNARLGVVLMALGLLASILWAHGGTIAWAGILVLCAAFAVLAVVHARVERAMARERAAARFHVRGLARLAFDWDALPATSSRFRSAAHPFSNDLDVFGRASLMQLVDATETTQGEGALAAHLAREKHESWPDSPALRQEAIRELAPRLAFRETLATMAGELRGGGDASEALLAWAEKSGAPWPRWQGGIANVLPGVALAAFGLTSLRLLPSGVAWVLGVATFAVGVVAGRSWSRMLAVVSASEGTATRWRAMMTLLEQEGFHAPLLLRLRSQLVASGRRASAELASLERIVGFVDARRNEVFRLLIAPVLMWDVQCAKALVRWQARAGAHLRIWLETLGEFEALASLAAFAFEHPAFAWPQFASHPAFEATELGHPLIANERRVGNDIALQAAGASLIVTGSNMSGKSTLLRAMGINAILASVGAPVCARAMRIGPLRVATSMRVEDSLDQGISHFYAELRRLKAVLDMAQSSEDSAVFFLLDEILHGTNSRERIAGAIAVVRQLMARGALGAVSTHDLGIAALEHELAGQVTNVHFEEQVQGSVMTFDYVLRSGIVQSSNALRLMRAIGIDVDE